MIKKIIRLFNSLIINNIKFIFIKIFHFRYFRFSFINYISPMNSIDIQGKGLIKLGKKLNIPQRSIIGVRENAIVEIGEGTFINNNCQIIAHKKIVIGKDTCIGPNTVIVDHDHIFDKNGVDKKKFKSNDIIIGSNVWIGANCVILKGTNIGDNCVIGACTILSGEIPNNSIVVQKKEKKITIIE